MNVHQFVSVALSLSDEEMMMAASFMIQAVETRKALGPKKKLPSLPPKEPSTRLLELVSGGKKFIQGRRPQGNEKSIQDYIVELAVAGQYSRHELATKVSEVSGCTYKQAYGGIGNAYTAGKVETVHGKIKARGKKKAA